MAVLRISKLNGLPSNFIKIRPKTHSSLLKLIAGSQSSCYLTTLEFVIHLQSAQ